MAEQVDGKTPEAPRPGSVKYRFPEQPGWSEDTARRSVMRRKTATALDSDPIHGSGG